MFQTFINAIGRGLRTASLAILRLIWEAFEEMVRGLARGASDSLRRAMPWIVGMVTVWMVMVFAPELFGLLLVIGIMIWALRFMIRNILPRPAQKKKK